MDYKPEEIENKWKEYWEKNNIYKVDIDHSKPKYYILDMFPYPSGAGLHVGHPLGYVASDIFSRYKRLCGFNVLHPMGYDAFGLPAEQYAIQTGVHPAVSTAENIKQYRSQLDKLGFSFDWSREVNTSDPKYYKWTQQIFIWLFEHYYDLSKNKAEKISELIKSFESHGSLSVNAANNCEESFSSEEWNSFTNKKKDDILMSYRLAYRKVAFVNWCEELGTVLANDEVKDGRSERGGYPVVQKPMMQWALRISAYAQRLLDDLEHVNFPEPLKIQQKNWIGRSEGAQLNFEIDRNNISLEVFTTRPDTIFGVTFMVVAPEHELLKNLVTEEQQKAVVSYLQYVESRTERDRLSDVKSVSGVFTGSYAKHPFNGKLIPVWISDYVLAGYGTGAIMAVPSDDERDQRFARHFNLEIIPVVDQSDFPSAEIGDKIGKIINSDFLNGLQVIDAIELSIQKIESLGIGKRKVNFRLRDANFSRQRYWGEPFPIYYDETGVTYIDDNLPVELPSLNNYQPTADGQSPLARVEDWVIVDKKFKRETDTMPGFAGSSWYFLRYMDPLNQNEMISDEAVNYWQDVDLYVGGSEHAVGHLMYSRFWHKFLYDLGKVPSKEPYKKLINQGMIQGVIENVYMQKERKDGKLVFVSADRISEYGGEDLFARIPTYIGFVSNYGSNDSHLNKDGIDSFRKFRPDYRDAIFICNEWGSLVTQSEVGKMSKRYHNVINPDDVVAKYGADCFRLYEMFLGPLEDSKPWNESGISGVSRFLRKLWSLFYDQEGNIIIENQEPDSKSLKVLHSTIKNVKTGLETFSFNTCVSDFMKAVNEFKEINCHNKYVLTDFTLLIAPFAPFIAEELWQILGNKESIFKQNRFPELNESFLKSDTIEYPVCINGKKRTQIELSSNLDQETVKKITLDLEEVKKWIGELTIQKIIVIPNKMINIVIS
jgi:leucyl-tRNA synthetase